MKTKIRPTCKEELMKAVKLFQDGENAQAQAKLGALDISQIVECLDTCTFEGMDMRSIAEYYDLHACSDCGYWHESDNMTCTADGEMVCENCSFMMTEILQEFWIMTAMLYAMYAETVQEVTIISGIVIMHGTMNQNMKANTLQAIMMTKGNFILVIWKMGN